MLRGRKRLQRVLLAFAIVVVGVGVWAASNAASLQARYAAYQMQNASSDDERAKWAHELAANSEFGLPRLAEFLGGPNEPCRAVAANTIAEHLESAPDADPAAAQLCTQILELAPSGDPPTQMAILQLVPTILKRTGTTHAARCREIVAVGLKSTSAESRLLSARVAMHPALKLRAEVLPLLSAPEPEVRRAAMFAVGPATNEEPVIGDEELFRWLHDTDAVVRKSCADALISRGRIEPEITLGRRLTHPDARERLELLRDLRFDDDLRDVEPWLERLSRDQEPAVRAGSARTAIVVCAERHLTIPAWVARLAENDPDPTVRRVARYYRTTPMGPSDPSARTILAP